ncbi:MAG: hypothetical protein WCI97_10950 [Bacteroidota bacterium]
MKFSFPDINHSSAQSVYFSSWRKKQCPMNPSKQPAKNSEATIWFVLVFLFLIGGMLVYLKAHQ